MQRYNVKRISLMIVETSMLTDSAPRDFILIVVSIWGNHITKLVIVAIMPQITPTKCINAWSRRNKTYSEIPAPIVEQVRKMLNDIKCWVQRTSGQYR
mmetsp:Transcript_31465/g.76773  ORF Transcript_31465/g.76773 Transcript_31465/m.76773 type:complete len:98 (+) Transcript_31465:622-915(+)